MELAMLDHHRRMFVYEQWANREVLSGLVRKRTPPGQAVALLAHIIAAQSLWMDRIQERASRIAVWPHWTLDQCHDEAQCITVVCNEALASLTPEDLEREFTYVNSAGRSFTSTVNDTLTHVVLHGTYHRAQIATTLRDEGFAPEYTDFIHATRNRLLEQEGERVGRFSSS
jgi:uncharacterized damage-inducible protein DinB